MIADRPEASGRRLPRRDEERRVWYEPSQSPIPQVIVAIDRLEPRLYKTLDLQSQGFDHLVSSCGSTFENPMLQSQA